VGSLPAYRVHVSGPEGRGFMTFIAYKGSIYRIDTISTGSLIRSFEGRGRAVARSFRPLTEKEKALFKVTRLEVVESRGGESLSALSARTANELDLPTTAVLNDLFINARLVEGQSVKIGRAFPYAPGESGEAEPPETAPAASS